MFDLGFTMEELMFPENYQYNFLFNIESNSLLDKSDEWSPIYDYPKQMIVDDDDWFTINQLNSNTSSTYNKDSFINDQTLPLSNVLPNNCYLGPLKSSAKIDDLLLPNLSTKIARDKNITSLSSDTVRTTSYSPPCAKRSLTSTTAITQKQQSNIYSTSKSSSSLSFCTQASISTTSSSDDGMSSDSKDLNEITTIPYSTEPVQKLLRHQHHHHKNNNSSSDDSSNVINRRRRKRTIFSAADIEHLKEAFIQNPKPSQQDIAVLSDQLRHDSYVIRVWFYNKRQATKKRNE